MTKPEGKQVRGSKAHFNHMIKLFCGKVGRLVWHNSTNKAGSYRCTACGQERGKG